MRPSKGGRACDIIKQNYAEIKEILSKGGRENSLERDIPAIYDWKSYSMKEQSAVFDIFQHLPIK
jgi:hypothetical protein